MDLSGECTRVTKGQFGQVRSHVESDLGHCELTHGSTGTHVLSVENIALEGVVVRVICTPESPLAYDGADPRRHEVEMHVEPKSIGAARKIELASDLGSPIPNPPTADIGLTQFYELAGDDYLCDLPDERMTVHLR